MKISNGSGAMFSCYVFPDVIHWTGAIEGDHDIDIVDGVWLQLHQCACHAVTVELEGAFGFSTSEHLKSFVVINGYVFYPDFLTFNLFNTNQSLSDNREISDTKEIELQKPGFFN